MEQPMQSRKAEVGTTGYKYMPFSEVNMHMRIAGKPMYFKVLSVHSVQLYKDEYMTQHFSGPITTGEAGVYTSNGPDWYYYPDDSKDKDAPSLENHPMNLANPLCKDIPE
jgi:hypothetical protein